MGMFDERAKARFLGALRKGFRKGQAAKYAGVSHHCINKRQRADPSFTEEIREAEEAACEAIEDVLWAKALAGHFPSIQMWLHNRCASRWYDRKPPTQVSNIIETGYYSPEVMMKKLEQALDEQKRRLDEKGEDDAS